jgi:excisionase family DNA binding protein
MSSEQQSKIPHSRQIKHRPETFERANWRVNDFLASFGIGRTKFYELVKSGKIKTVKCGRTTLIPHGEALAYQERLEGGA